MRIPFSQGILKHQTDQVGSPTFLTITSNGVSFNVVDTITIITMSHGDVNYLFNESTSIPDAWSGPFDAPNDYWLYWDINVVTGIRTFGNTTLPPTYGPTAPASPVTDQHWFDTVNNQMKVHDGTDWAVKIRVFAAKFEGAAVLKNMADPADFGFIGTQVQLTTAVDAGYLFFDTTGIPVKRNDGTFFTTDSEFITQIPTGSHVKLEAMVIEAVAQANIPKYRAVYFSDFNEIIAGEPITTDDYVFGVIEEDVVTGNAIKVIVEGVIHNPAWNWSSANTLVYANTGGEITETFTIAEQVPLGVAIDTDKILLRAPRIQLESGLRNNASEISRGISKLTVAAVDPYEPIVVGDNDPRMSNARVPLAHIHDIVDVTDLQTSLDAKVDLAGSTMTGVLTLSGAPTLPNHAANKQYVDDQFADVTGDTFLGILNMNNNAITNLPSPVDVGDAVNKAYVDDNYLNLNTPSAMGANIDMASLYTIENIVDPINPGDAVSKSYADTTYLNSDNDTVTGYLTLSNAPTLAGHATRKSWVDTNFINVDGSVSMVGELTLAGSPSAVNHAVHKNYVDTNFINADGSVPMSGVLAMGANAITGVANPTNAQDVVTKYYADTSYINTIGDTMTGALSMGGNKITSMLNPTDPGDAVNKTYGDTTYVLSAGSTMTGYLTLSADPVSIMHAATKQYVDTVALSVSGGTMSGNLDMGTLYSIINLADPVSAQDAVTRSYADTNYINAAGDTMTGTLVLNVAPSGVNDAVNKNYVDTTFMNINGTVSMTADLNMGAGYKIINLGTPLSATDAASKGYVDTTFLPLTGGTVSNFITLNADPINALHPVTKQYFDSNAMLASGSIMTGYLTLNADPSAALHAATKQYVDDNTLAVTGGALSGSLDMNGNAVIDLPLTPVNPADAASKSYVDTHVSLLGGVMAGDLSFNNLVRATDLPAPLLGGDAANKTYVDAKVDLGGDTMVGVLDMNGNALTNLPAPLLNGDATNKQYVDGTFVTIGGDTMAGDLNMANLHRITNMPNPTTGTDAVNKAYVDSNFVLSTGDTMSGFLILNANPTNALGAVTKQYVDNNYLMNSGDTMSGDLSMGGLQRVTNLAAPSLGGDAANKTYVDGLVSGLVDDTGHVWVGPGVLDMGGVAIDNLPLTPSAAAEAASKQYVDARVLRAGDTMSGDLSFNSLYNITDLPDPTLAQHPATKAYTDTQIDTVKVYDLPGFIDGKPKVATAGSQTVVYSIAKVGGDATGLANDATIYTASVSVNGSANAIAVTGSAAQTFTTLLNEINIDLTGATATLDSNGNIVITSDTTGADTAIVISDTDLFNTTTNYRSIDIQQDGTSAVLWQTMMVRDCTIDVTGEADTAFSAATPSVGTVGFELKKNGVAFGTITFNVGVTSAAMVVTETTFVVGDVLTVETTEVTLDDELADVGFIIAGQY